MRLLASALLLSLLGGAAPPAEQRSFMVAGFERLRVDGPFEVDVIAGSAPSARADGTRAELDRMTIRAEGSTLVVGSGPLGWEVRARDGIALPRVTITAPRLAAVLVTGGGKVRVEALRGPRVEAGVNGSGSLAIGGIDAEDLSATLTGAGALTLSGKAVTARFNSYGAGSIDASGLVANDLVVRGNTSGEGRYNARFTARVSAMGSGSVRVEGKPKCFVAGTGPVSCGANDNIDRR